METSRNRIRLLTIIISSGLLVFSLFSWYIFLQTDFISEISGKNISEISKIIEDEFSDHIYKKSSLAKKDALMTYLLTGEISSSQVKEGDDGWLFYLSESDGNPLGIYEGSFRLSDDELEAIRTSVSQTADYLEEKNIEFGLLVIPDKETIYSEYVPKKYQKADATSTEQIDEVLKSLDINYAYLKEMLLANKNADYPLYYKTDTHWNKIGGYLGAKAALEMFDIKLPELSELTIDKVERDAGDLANMANISQFLDYELDYFIKEMPVISQKISDDLVELHNPSAHSSKTVLIVGDSFRKGLLAGMLYEFENVYVVHRDYYETEMLDDINPDYLFAIYVERYAPKMNGLAETIIGN